MKNNSIKIHNLNHSLQFALMKRKETIKLLINTIQLRPSECSSSEVNLIICSSARPARHRNSVTRVWLCIISFALNNTDVKYTNGRYYCPRLASRETSYFMNYKTRLEEPCRVRWPAVRSCRRIPGPLSSPAVSVAR